MSAIKVHVNLQHEQHSCNDCAAKTLFVVFPTLPHICRFSTELVPSLRKSGGSEFPGSTPHTSA